MFRGQFKFKTASGKPLTYNNGDVVVYDGKVYQSNTITQMSPLQSSKDWTYVSLTEPYRGTNPPVDPKENQIWVADNGVTYIYFNDGNSSQWIST